MATTIDDLLTRAGYTLDDAIAAYWSEYLLRDWVREGIRELSIRFPKTVSDTITTAAATREYDLPLNFLDMVLCEYPTGEDPKTYLTRQSRKHPDFWSTDGLYDVQSWEQLTEPTLYISTTPAADETITITYTARYNEDLAMDDDVDIPAQYEHIVILFMVWKAHTHRIGKEMQGPDTTIQLLSQFKAAAWEARDAYYKAIAAAEKRHAESAITGPWGLDEFDRIY